jgi:multiple sugar transport system substrate-binding protein
MSHRRPRRAALAAGAALALLTAACGGSGFEGDENSNDSEKDSGPASLEILIGSSGPAETDAVTAAADKWAKDSGNEVEVIAATDLNQQLSQGFAANKPPDVFYLSSDTFAEYASNGSLLPYAGDLENADDFYPNLAEAFTFDDEFYCAPSRPSAWSSTPTRGKRPA